MRARRRCTRARALAAWGRNAIIAGLLPSLLAACGGSQANSADHSLATADGRAMTQTSYAIPAAQAAHLVTEQTGDQTVEALHATGDTSRGVVVLRISSIDQREGGTVTHCYRYTFGPRYDSNPEELSNCPNLPPLDLSRPVAVPPLDHHLTERLRRALAAAGRARPLTVLRARRVAQETIRDNRDFLVWVDRRGPRFRVDVQSNGTCLLQFVRSNGQPAGSELGTECLR